MSTALVFASISRHSSRLLFKNASQSIAKRSLSTAMINLSPSSSTSTSNIINSNYSKPYINNKPLFSSPLQQSIRTTASKEIGKRERGNKKKQNERENEGFYLFVCLLFVNFFFVLFTFLVLFLYSADANHIEDALNDPTATPGESVLLTSRDTVEGRVIVEG